MYTKFSRKAIILALFPVILLLFACEPFAGTTIEFVDDGAGYFQFYTDDPQNKGTAFYYIVSGSTQDPMTTVEANVEKKSGSWLRPAPIIRSSCGTSQPASRLANRSGDIRRQ